jgi:hypothetical protein
MTQTSILLLSSLQSSYYTDLATELIVIHANRVMNTDQL